MYPIFCYCAIIVVFTILYFETPSTHEDTWGFCLLIFVLCGKVGCNGKKKRSLFSGEFLCILLGIGIFLRPFFHLKGIHHRKIGFFFLHFGEHSASV